MSILCLGRGGDGVPGQTYQDISSNQQFLKFYDNQALGRGEN